MPSRAIGWTGVTSTSILFASRPLIDARTLPRNLSTDHRSFMVSLASLRKAPRDMEAVVNRWSDWWEQGQRDLRHAEHALADADYEWAAFAAQQAAEKAAKAVIMHLGGDPWGHSVTLLLESLAGKLPPAPEGIEAANRLDKHYIPSRYPNGLAASYPGKLYTKREAEGAIADARIVIEFCRRHLP